MRLNGNDDRVLAVLKGIMKKEDLKSESGLSDKQLENSLRKLLRHKLIKKAKKQGYYKLTGKGREQAGGKIQVKRAQEPKESEIAQLAEPVPESEGFSQEIEKLLKSEELEPESNKSKIESRKARSGSELWADLLLKGVGEVKKILSSRKPKKQKKSEEEKSKLPPEAGGTGAEDFRKSQRDQIDRF